MQLETRWRRRIHGIFDFIEITALVVAVWFAWAGSEHGLTISATVVALSVYAAKKIPRVDVRRQEVASFLEEGQALLARKDEKPLPILEHNDWVNRMEKYFEDIGRPDLKTRLGNFSGMTFYGSGTERSKYKRAVDGRIRRLLEILSETSS